MIEHAKDVFPLLMWMILVTGGSLVALLIWIGRRLDAKVEAMPALVSQQIGKVHDEIIRQMQELNATHQLLEQDVREQLAALDRRVIRLEVRCDMNHGKA